MKIEFQGRQSKELVRISPDGLIERIDWDAVDEVSSEARSLSSVDPRFLETHHACALIASAVRDMYKEKVEAWSMLEDLRGPPGHSVVLSHSNTGQDFSVLVEVTGDWTEWAAQRFYGNSVLETIRSAHEAMLLSKGR